ncbi:MAG: hypothetical protein MRJ68_20575 [Nitrospira sp.]|nr:hypothetical protein [Nitrospira sp.]
MVSYLVSQWEGQRMTMTAVSQCARCAAVVNVHWPSCLVCRAVLPPVPDVPVSAELIQGNQGRAREPVPPILPGWLVTYRDQAGRLCGGADDRAHGTVRKCQWNGTNWTLHLTDGQRLPLAAIPAVSKTDTLGRIVGAWSTRDHGYDGER